MPVAGNPPIDAEPEDVFPARYWWLKRFTVGIVVVALCLAGVRVWWGRVADKRLQAVLDAVAARGEPVRGDDLNPSEIPPGGNAAEYFKQAASAVDQTAWSPANTAMNFTAAYTPHSPGWEKTAAAAVAANPKVYALARRARAFDQFDWGTRMTPTGFTMPLSHLNEARMIANTLGDAALYAHVKGDDVAALELIRDVRHEARAVEAPPLLISALVGIGIDALSLARLQEIAPGLRISDGDGPPPPLTPGTGPYPTTNPVVPPRGVTAANVRALINELLDERANPGDVRQGFAGERAANVELIEGMSRSARLVGPLFKLDLVRLMRSYDVAISAASLPTWPAARPPLATAAPSTPLGNLLLPSLGRSVEQAFRVTNERRMVAVALAVRLYHAEHGDWPASLDTLVPKYLPAVPADVFAADGSPLRYLLIPGGRPDGADRPVVYSMGADGLDDTGSGRVKVPTVEMYGWQARVADQWRDLSRWPPPAPPATAPAGTQPAVR